LKIAFAIVKKQPTKNHLESLKILTGHLGKSINTNRGKLLFVLNRLTLFPDSLIRCARFKGLKKKTL
jgi:predicted HTH transcriptional regulator